METVLLPWYVGNVVRIVILIFVGIPLVRWCTNVFASICRKRLSQHAGVLVGRIIFYSGLTFIGVTVLHECGFNIAALLGAAGVIGVAIGFASQTSISNIISGFFLLAERPFSVGDIIKSDDVSGVVESIDLLSVRMRTVDNKLVRLPNETVLKNSLINLTYYPQKRVDLLVSVPYTQDVITVKQMIHDAIVSSNLFSMQPVPIIGMDKIGQHDYDTEIRMFFMVRVWVVKEMFNSAPTVLMEQLKSIFDTQNIIITVVHVNRA